MYDDEKETDNKDGLASYVWRLIEGCQSHLDDQSKSRERSLEYYNGEMNDLPADDGRSSVVSQDVRSVIKKLMPSVMRTMLSNDKVVEYDPVGEDDSEEDAILATQYINHVVVPESKAEEALFDAIFDAATVKTGILKWTAYKRNKAIIKRYNNQPEDTLIGLEGEQGIEVIIHDERPEQDPEILNYFPDAKRVDFSIRQMQESTEILLQAIPRGSFLISPNADCIEDSPIVGEKQHETRSELISRGYDKEDVFSIPCYDNQEADDEDSRKGADANHFNGMKVGKAVERVEVFEVYVKIDQDDDGIAELYKILMAEGGEDGGENHIILDMEPVEEVPYSAVKLEREAFQFEGRSLAEDIIDIQRVKTSLIRETLDNTYWQNRTQPVVDPSRLTEDGLDALEKPEFGRPITVEEGVDTRTVLSYDMKPYVADKTFSMMQYFDEELRDRTGITDESGGVDPEIFQNMAATNANLLSQAGVAQSEMIIRSLARGGIKKAFKGLLKLTIQHTQKPRTVTIDKKRQTYDPSQWNIDMDCRVNVGLGAGSREKDLNVLQMILGLQERLLASIGTDNPYVKPEQLYNTLEKITETAGFPSATPYFTKPDPQEIKAKQAQAQNQPSEAEMKMKADAQIEQIKSDARKGVEEAQMQADLIVDQARLKNDAMIEEIKGNFAAKIAEMKAAFDLKIHTDKMNIEQQKVNISAMQKQNPPVRGGYTGA